MQRLDISELADLVVLAPGEEPADSRHIGRAGVPVADGGGEEFEKALGRMLAGIGDHHRHHHGARGRNGGCGRPNDGQLAACVGGFVNLLYVALFCW